MVEKINLLQYYFQSVAHNGNISHNSFINAIVHLRIETTYYIFTTIIYDGVWLWSMAVL